MSASATAVPVAATASRSLFGSVVALLSSLELAVVLVVYLGILTWLGTLAQVELGLYRTQQIYFEGWFVPILGGVLRIPGAYPVMALMCLNLLFGGIARLNWNWRNAGVLITHIGIALLFVQGFVKMHYSTSGHLTLYEKQQGASFVSFHDWELALYQQDGDTVRERVIPSPGFRKASGVVPAVFGSPDLPFAIEVRHFHENTTPMPKGPMVQTTMPVVNGVFLQVDAQAPERERNIAGCYATIRGGANNQVLAEGVLWGLTRDQRRHPFTFEVDGVRWGLDLRRVTQDLPFSVKLDRFVRVTYPGTELPKEFSSYVTVTDEQGTSESSHIYMNAPLRKDGYVMYQASWGPERGGPPYFSQFEVARNPSDRWSILSCAVIGIGMTIHFLRKLLSYIRSENLKAAHAKAGAA